MASEKAIVRVMHFPFLRWLIVAALLLASFAALMSRFGGGVFLSLGNLRMLSTLEQHCGPNECLAGGSAATAAGVEQAARWFRLAEKLDPQNKRIQIGRGTASFLAGDYAAAFKRLAPDQHDAVLYKRVLEAAWRADEKAAFLSVYASDELPEMYRQQFQPVAASYYVDRAQQAATYALQENWLAASLQVWPDNLCALSAGAALSLESKSSTASLERYIKPIYQRAFDGAFATSPVYQACLLEWLPRLAADRRELLPIVEDVFERWVWQDTAPGFAANLTRLIELSPPSATLYKLLGDAHLAAGDWRSAQAAYQAAAAQAVQPQSAQAYAKLSQSLETMASFIPGQISYAAASQPDGLDGLWVVYQQARQAGHTLLAAEALVRLQEKLGPVFASSEAHITLNADWALSGWYIETRQLELSRRITLWLLLERAVGRVPQPEANWIELNGRWVARIDGVNVIPNAGFEVSAGTGTFMPWEYGPFEPEVQGGVAVAEERQGNRSTQTLVLANLGPDRGAVIMTAPQPIEPGHLYMFVGWMKAQRANASGHGGLAACRWLNADGVAVGYHEFLSGYAHVDWQNHLHLTETPLNARWCKFMLLNNDPANRIWFDDLMLMDINSVVKAAP